MNRCEAHDLLNCKCREPLSAYLVRQFRESPHVRVVRTGWDGAGDHSGSDARSGAGDPGRGQRGEPGGAR